MLGVKIMLLRRVVMMELFLLKMRRIRSRTRIMTSLRGGMAMMTVILNSWLLPKITLLLSPTPSLIFHCSRCSAVV